MIKVLELFGGIGSPRKALERLGIPHEVVDYVEIDKFAVKSYNAMYNENYEPQNVCEWDKNIEVDLIFHGSPCQDFSLAGKQAGGDKDSGTRSSLLYETVRIVEKLKPKYVIWENVKNVISKKHKHTFDNYLHEMEMLGYTNYYQVLNAKDCGIPQNRDRVFTVSILGEHDLFDFPPKQELKLRLKDMLEDEVDEKYYLSSEVISKLESYGYEQSLRLNNIDKTCETINTMGGGHREPKITIKEATKQGYKKYKRQPLKFLKRNQKNITGDYSFCVDASQTGVIKEIENGKNRIRKLTPKECWRLMGFDDADFEKAEQVNSNTQLYKQAGNSIVVNVLEAIFKELFKNG